MTRRDRRAFCDQASLGVRLVALLTLPAGVLLFVLRRAIVGALLQHGEYTAANADNTARALGGFALGLVGFSLYLFVLRGFYAHQDTRTPFVINVVQNVLNIVLAVALVGRYDIGGLGAALAISYVVCAAWALQVLAYKVPGFPLRDVFASLWRMALAGADRRRGDVARRPRRSVARRASTRWPASSSAPSSGWPSTAPSSPRCAHPSCQRPALGSVGEQPLPPRQRRRHPVERVRVQTADPESVRIIGEPRDEVGWVVATGREHRRHHRPVLAQEPQRGADAEPYAHRQQRGPVDDACHADVDRRVEPGGPLVGRASG